MILAAGEGKRMKSDLPKVLQTLAGRPLLSYVIDAARALSPAEICVVHGHGGDRVQQHFGGAALRWSLQAQQLGTGHAAQCALKDIDDTHRVLILYGDVPLIRTQTLQQLLDAAANGVGLLTAQLPDPNGYGRIVRDRRKRITRIVEQRDANAGQLRIDEVNTGVLVAPARLLQRWLGKLKTGNAQREYYLTDVIGMAVRDKVRIASFRAENVVEVQGVNDKMQLATLEREYRRIRSRELMQAGATIIDPERIDIRGEVTVGKDVSLEANVLLEGPVHLGDGVRIGPNCQLHDVRIGAGTVVHANCWLQRAEIGPGCQIGPFARIRPDTTLAEGVHIGNFVEVKNTQVGAGSKANHLTYLGDASIGAHVNVGAGTVTCNYDGANKWRTEIGDEAFIGSGSMLVAPVRIGAGATIGANSTITREAPTGKLTLARAPQVTREDWQRPVKGAVKKKSDHS